MASYLVSYDLNEPEQNYDDLHSALESYSGWWHNLDSTWIIVTSDSVSTIRDDLKQHVDNNDELLVVKLSGAWATYNVDGTDWLYDHL